MCNIYCFYSTSNYSFACFWSYSGRYSFYTFCLMDSLKKVFEQTEIQLVLYKECIFEIFMLRHAKLRREVKCNR